MEIWYFETSALNEFMKGRTVEDALATKQLQLNKGREWRLSPVTLWEILMTSDEMRREEIIYFCQHLFSRELLPSPAELIIPWIEQGMPNIEIQRELKSNTVIAKVWKELVDDRKQTFKMDHEDLKSKVKLFQSVTKDIHSIINNKDYIISSNEKFSGLDFTVSNLVKELPFVKAGDVISKDETLAYKVSLFYIMYILCAEVELENEVIMNFWKRRGIDSTLDRILYVVKELPELVHRGPFIMMSYMTIAQSDGKHSRGVWYDSLHAVYITYVDKIFTSDDHFRGLREVIPAPILKYKVHHLDEVTFTNHSANMFGVPE
ncbi:MAG: hypothetical protein GXO84_04515 [Chlorobi bacterium]|nr:hypothetical protein [Chlorobiota bacterium]